MLLQSTNNFDLKYARRRLNQLTHLSLRRVLSLVINSSTAEKALSASTDVGGMDSIAAVILVMFAIFSPVAFDISNSLAMLLLIARLVWTFLGMYYVSFLLLPLISRTALLVGFDISGLTESVTFLLRNGIRQAFCHRFRHEGE